VNHKNTVAIVLRRTNYGEADRIVNLLTRDHGVISLIARGVRKPKSKLAGGIEFFSVSNVSYIEGKGSLGTLTSTSLIKYYDRIVKDIHRVDVGYKMIKLVLKTVEDGAEEAYFSAVEQFFTILNDLDIDINLTSSWFQARLLTLAGHQPNLKNDSNERPLEPDNQHGFSLIDMCFNNQNNGQYDERDIKFMRLLFIQPSPTNLASVEGYDQILKKLSPLIDQITKTHL